MKGISHHIWNNQLCQTHVNCVIERAMLGNRAQDGLVIGRSIDRGELVSTSRKTIVNISGQDPISVRFSVQTLEECKDSRIRGVCLTKRAELFDNNVRVSLNNALRVQLLRSTEIVLVSIDEVASFQILDRHLDGELLVGRHFSSIGWEDKFGRRHFGLGRDFTHGDRIARTIQNLLTVGNFEVRCGQTEVDEVVG